jgi:hypothetical protein
VDGSQNWHFDYNYSDWAIKNGPFYLNDTLGKDMFLIKNSIASNYRKLAIFTIGVWAGATIDSVLIGLAACGVMMSIVSTASDFM